MYGRRRYPTKAQRAKFAPYRSGLEKTIADDMMERGVSFEYETVKLKYKQPSVIRSYTPDFILKCNDREIMVEVKGEFTAADRKKTLLVLEQYPDIDLRFVFGSPGSKLSKRSKTTYAQWCNQHGIKWAGRKVPQEWIQELYHGKNKK
jgi:predicted nuclease of restriction endonuclease-like RecB superfamily